MDQYDAVSGYRLGKKESLPRLIASAGYDMVIALCFGFYLRNSSFSFKLIKRTVLEQLDLRSDGWFLPVELLVELKKRKFKITQISIPFVHRTQGDSKVSILPVIKNLLKEIYAYKRRS